MTTRMIVRAMAAGLLLVAAVAPAHARLWPSTAGWDIIEGDDYCAVSQTYEGPGDTGLILVLRLDDGVLLSVSNSQWSINDDQRLDLSYHVNGTSYGGAKAVGVKHSILRKGFAALFGPEFAQDFVKSTYLHIYNGETVVDKLRLDGSAAAVAEARKCLAYLKGLKAAEAREKARWAHIPKDPFAKPVTPGEPVPMATKAAPNGNGSWVTNADYPDASIRAGESGVTEFKLDVGTDGRVTNCTITQSSGSSVLDNTTCRMIQRRAKFQPAKDSNGNPTTDTYSSRFRWVLPGQ